MDQATVAKLDKTIFPFGGMDFYGALAGGSHASKRQAVMSILGETLPKSKCGLTLVRHTIAAKMEANGGCERDRENDIVNKLVASRSINQGQ